MNKAKVYISYGTNESNLSLGNFDEIPENASIAKLTIETYKTDENGKEACEKGNCIMYIGTSYPANMFIGTYSRDLNTIKLMELKEGINNGKTRILVLDNDKNNFIFIDEKASVFTTREDFENNIHSFKTRFSNSVEFVEYNEITSKRI